MRASSRGRPPPGVRQSRIPKNARWDELHQRGYGVAVPFETAKVYGVQFEAVIDDTKGKTSEFHLDNVSFFRTTPDLTPIAP